MTEAANAEHACLYHGSPSQAILIGQLSNVHSKFRAVKPESR